LLVTNRSCTEEITKANFGGCPSESKGVSDMIAQLTTLSKACPNQSYVIGGHSQGAVVTTTVVRQMPKELLPKLLAVTMFGAPACPEQVAGRCKSYCNKGDDVSAT
jgi:predicted esterase